MNTPTIPKNLDNPSSKQLMQIILNSSIYARSAGVNTTISASLTPTKINLSAPIASKNVKYDSVNHKLIILVEGPYNIMGFVFFNNPSTASVTYQALVYKNGSPLIVGFDPVATTSVGKSITAEDLVFLKKNDYIELFAQTGSGSTQTTQSNYLYLFRI